MRRIFSSVLFAAAFLLSLGSVSPRQAEARWTGLDPTVRYTTAIAACHSAQDRNGGIKEFFPILGAFPGGVIAYQCNSSLNGGPIQPFCDSLDLGPVPDASLPGGCSAAPAPDAKAVGCSCSGGASVGDPINVNIGNTFEQVTDYESAGPNKLAFIRYYNSQTRYFSSLGFHWQSNFDRRLFFEQQSIGAGRDVVLLGGAGVRFPNAGGAPVSTDSDMDETLTPGSTTYVLTDHDDTVETFGFPSGLLLSITSRNGYTQTLHYNAQDPATGLATLASVSDSYGRTLTFSYVNGVLQTMTDPDGHVYTYNYDTVNLLGPDRLRSVVYPGSSSPTVQYLYENTTYPFALTGIIDENNNRFATWAYDATLRATSSQHAGGADLTTLAYNADGSATVANALGEADTYKFTTLQGMPKVTEIDRAATSTTAAATRHFTYDANGYLASETDWNGNLTTYVNDARGQVTSKTEVSGTSLARTTTTTYLTTFHVPTQIVEPGRTTSFTYDSLGRVLTKTQTDTTTSSVPYSTAGRTRSWSYTYTATGELATVNGPLSDVTTYGYDSSGALISVTNALSQVTQVTAHDASGRPQTIVDPNGVTTTLGYDSRDRLTSTSIATAGGNAVTSIAYDLAGNVTQITRPDGSFLAYSYDAAHRLTQVTDATGATITYTLDAMGDRTQTQIAASGGTVTKTQSQVFDELGRLLKNIGAAGQTTIYAYDSNGNATSITDPLSQVTGQSFDALNRLIEVAAPLSATTNDAYDAHDNRIGVTDPRALVTSYVYDGLDNLIQVSSPDTGTTVYVTDAAGNRTQSTDAAGNVVQFTYDLLSRRTTKTYAPNNNEAYTYDGSGAGAGIGRLTSVTFQLGSAAFIYDALGNVTQETRILDQRYVTAYAYDLASHVMQMTYPSGRIVTYARDAMGRITGATTETNSSASPVAIASGGLYEPFGPLAALTYGNGLNLSVQFDQDYQPSARIVTGTANVQNLGYSFDAAGDLTAINDNLITARSQSLQYDALYRLTQASGAYGTFSYGYDPVGNRTSLGLTNSSGSTSSTYNYAATSNQLQTVVTGTTTRTLTYGATGNITSDDLGNGTVYNFIYNGDNRLEQASHGSTFTDYTHDYLGQRTVRIPANAFWHYDRAGYLIGESNVAGFFRREYVWLDDLPVAFFSNITGGQLYYIHTDHLGAPQKMTDGSQNIVWDGAASDPFMLEPLPTNLTMNLRLPGQQFDAETGLHYNGMRDYDPTLGRYIESDPIGLDGGTNTYAYADGNPVRFMDPDGLSASSVAQSSLPLSSDDAKPKMCVATNDDSGPGNHNWCVQRCTELTLPTGNHGIRFQRCYNQCMGRNSYPEWKGVF